MDINDVLIVGLSLIGVSVFTWFILQLLSKNNVAKFNLEVSEWIKISVERVDSQDDENIQNGSIIFPPKIVYDDDNNKDSNELWMNFERNMEKIKTLLLDIKVRNQNSSKKFPITIDILQKMKYLRMRYESVGSVTNITREELLTLTESSFVVITFLNGINN